MSIAFLSFTIILFGLLCFFPRLRYSGDNTKVITPSLIVIESKTDIKVFLRILTLTIILGGIIVKAEYIENVEMQEFQIMFLMVYYLIIWIISFLMYLKIIKILRRKYVVFEDILEDYTSRENIENRPENLYSKFINYFKFKQFESLYKLYVKATIKEIKMAKIHGKYYIVAFRNFYLSFSKDDYILEENTKLIDPNNLLDEGIVKKSKQGFYY